MVNRKNRNVAKEIELLNKPETSAKSEHISKPHSARQSKSKENDDLIVSLSDAYENKRARQVFEWERIRRQNVQRAA